MCVIAVNFNMVDFTRENGPIRQIPATQNLDQRPPPLRDEPASMKLSTVCPLPAGSAIFRDNRAWHGGTPNLSDHVRAIPNVEYAVRARDPFGAARVHATALLVWRRHALTACTPRLLPIETLVGPLVPSGHPQL